MADSNRYSDLVDFVNGLEADFTAFYDKGNKAAGTLIRKAMQEIKQTAQEIRLEVQAMKNA